MNFSRQNCKIHGIAMDKPAEIWYTLIAGKKCGVDSASTEFATANSVAFWQASCFDSTGAKHHGIAFTSNDFGLPRPKSGLLAALQASRLYIQTPACFASRLLGRALIPLRNNLEQKEVRRENERRDLCKVFQ